VAQVGWLGPKVSGHLAPFLYSSHEPSELSQLPCYDDSTINIVVVIIIISSSSIIIIIPSGFEAEIFTARCPCCRPTVATNTNAIKDLKENGQVKQIQRICMCE